MIPPSSTIADTIREQLALYRAAFTVTTETVRGRSTVVTGSVAGTPLAITVRSSDADGRAYRYSVSVTNVATGEQIGLGNPDRTPEAAIRFFHWQDVALATRRGTPRDS